MGDRGLSVGGRSVRRVLHLIFFFQAEDGIRDRNVTGVQTCALPICEGLAGADPIALGHAVEEAEAEREAAEQRLALAEQALTNAITARDEAVEADRV